MSTIMCSGCGNVTNTAVSNYWQVAVDIDIDIDIDIDQGKKEDISCSMCYARFKDSRWEKGCAYDKANPWTQQYVDKLIEGQEKL